MTVISISFVEKILILADRFGHSMYTDQVFNSYAKYETKYIGDGHGYCDLPDLTNVAEWFFHANVWLLHQYIMEYVHLLRPFYMVI